MNHWMQAFHVAKFEMRQSILGLIGIFIFLIFFAIMLSITDLYIDKKSIGIDILFIILFTYFPLWMRPKELRFQKVNEDSSRYGKFTSYSIVYEKKNYENRLFLRKGCDVMNWQHVWSLTKFELKHAKYHLLLHIAMLTLITLIALSTISMHLEQGDFSLDFLFLFGFMMLPLIIWRSKAYNYQKLQEGVWGTPILVLLQQLPTPKQVIMMSRFVFHLIVIIPFQLLSFVALFISSPTLQQTLTVSEYTAFTIMWIALSILFYWAQAFNDFGTIQSAITWIGRIFLIIILIVLFFILFYGIYKHGFVHWTVSMATAHPILSIVTSLLFAIIGTISLKNLIERKIAQFDYF